jgi:arylsulfatase A-like enzyme
VRRLPRPGRIVAAAAVGVLALTGAAVLDLHSGLAPVSHAAERRPVSTPPARPASVDRPNIVFVLTDDLSSELVRYMPHVAALARRGMSFSNYTVSDSLCCPSRTSILTGMYPHDSGVFTNTGADGGFETFYAHGDQNHTFATALQAAGYRTAFMGKYLNGYEARVSKGTAPPEYVPPGWSEWDGSGDGYGGYGYTINHDGRVQRFGGQPDAYLTTELQRRGVAFMQSALRAHARFMLEVATFTPHFPYVPAPADRHTFGFVRAPRPPSFDRLPAHAPRWLATHRPLSPGSVAALDAVERKRVEDVQSIDRMVAAFERTAAAHHALSDTVFVFSSDNGLHLGEYRLGAGKLTAFDTDVVVPLIIAGPHIRADQVSDAVVQNVDLAPTFEQLAGAPVPPYVDGHSLVPLLHGRAVPWRTVALIEHHGPAVAVGDPDRQDVQQGNPPSYEALRTATYTFVRYADGEREYYDRVRDPWELHNIWRSLSAARRRHLLALVDALASCHGAGCWLAGEPAG